MSIHKNVKKVTTHTLQEMKNAGEKISMLTGYDFSMAKIIDEAGMDVILVGDSASNVMAGHETTLPITLDQMIYHASSVVRAVDRALIVVDFPVPLSPMIITPPIRGSITFKIRANFISSCPTIAVKGKTGRIF